jgi:hypothetical protein
MGILIFKGLTARRLYKSFGVKGLIVSAGTTSKPDTYVDQITFQSKSLLCSFLYSPSHTK